MIQYVLACKKGKLHPQVGVVLWRWHEGGGPWLKDLLLTNHCWSRSSRVAGPGVKRRWLSNELQTPSIVAVVFEALQLWQRRLELVFGKTLDFGAGYYGCHTTDITTLAVDIENDDLFIYFCCIRAWSIGTRSSSLSPLTPSLYACLQHCGVIPSGAYQPPLGNRLQVLNL